MIRFNDLPDKEKLVLYAIHTLHKHGQHINVSINPKYREEIAAFEPTVEQINTLEHIMRDGIFMSLIAGGKVSVRVIKWRYYLTLTIMRVALYVAQLGLKKQAQYIFDLSCQTGFIAE